MEHPTISAIFGRASAVRIKIGSAIDFAVISAYPPPKSGYRSREVFADAVWDWVASYLDRLPRRCTPIILTDANAKLGQDIHAAYGELAGPAGPFPCDSSNERGWLFAKFLESHSLCAVNTFVSTQPTSWAASSTSQSCIDYVCVPKAMIADIKVAKVLHSTGARLQLIKHKGFADHHPLLVKLPINLHHQSNAVRRPCRWDFDLLRTTKSMPSAAGEFLQKVYDDMHELIHAKELEPNMSPDVLYTKITKCIMQHSEIIMQKRPTSLQALGKERRELLQCLGDAHAKASLSLRLASLQESVLKSWSSVVALAKVQKKYKVLVAKKKEKLNDLRVASLHEAYRAGNPAECSKISRLIAGKLRGARNRRTNVFASSSPSCADWKAFLAQEGFKGGLQAVEIAAERTT